ncbi:MAG: twin-arginine translocase subunit TatC [Gemmatimonadota bacterium]
MTERRINPKGEMPFLDHLEELRWRILWSLFAVVAGTLLGFFIVQRFGVIQILLDPLQRFRPDTKLIALALTDGFFVTLKLALVVGLVLSFPILIYQVWSFLSPALEKEERRVIVPSLYFGLLLFLAGAAMAYFIALPVTIPFLLGFQSEFLESTLEVNRYFGFVTKLLIGFGVVFELPVVVMILSALGLVTPHFLRSKRRHALVINTIIASFLSPGDVITLTVLMMVPLVLLYEVSIWLSAVIHRRRENRILSASDEPPEGAVGVGG